MMPGPGGMGMNPYMTGYGGGMINPGMQPPPINMGMP